MIRKIGILTSGGDSPGMNAAVVSVARCAAMNGMATFEEAQIDDGYLAPIRESESFRVEPDERTANEGREAR